MNEARSGFNATDSSCFLVGVLCAGVLIARYFSGVWLSSWGWLVLFSGFAISLVVVQKQWALVFILITGALLGYVRGNIQMQAVLPAEEYIGSKVILRGTVDGDIGTGKSGEVALRLKSVYINNKKLAGRY
ncbi:hypothetical protein GX865_03005 [Candidatus Saccharibacteria bacterium]|nr:hypothetical protein [Candidatus Saccharibacteria bacterium]